MGWCKTVNAAWWQVARRSRGLRYALLAMLLASVGASSGCRMFPTEEENKGPKTMSEFLKRPRPGEGILGR